MPRVLMFTFILLLGCSEKSYRLQNDQVFVTTQDQGLQSTSAGNLIATAIKEANDLDVVLYPTALIPKGAAAIVTRGNAETELLEQMPEGVQDQFLVGLLSGKQLKSFILERSNELYQLELEAAGLKYHIHYVGGFPRFNYVNSEDDLTLDDNEYYRVALSNWFFFSGAFPGYRYRNGMSFTFTDITGTLSAKESLRRYLHSAKAFPYLNEIRAKVSTTTLGHAGHKTIPEIQGISHRSPLYGYRVTTVGIVTAQGVRDWYPGGMDIIIQSEKGDGNPLTSEALHLYLRDESMLLKLGDKVRVTGVVFEELANSGLGKTTLRQISEMRVISRGHELPAPVTLGNKGIRLPSGPVSTWRGNLNLKPALNLNDAVDFYESMEGMRILISNPKVVGFRGGKEEYESSGPKGHMTLYVLPDGKRPHNQNTNRGGILINAAKNDFNSEIMTIATNHLTKGVDTANVFNVGDVLEGDITGVLSYEKNLFGGGEYTIVLPEEQTTMSSLNVKDIVPLEDRPVTRLIPTEDHLSVATYNVENLSAPQHNRLREIGKSIAYNMKCPDIIALVEIQDNNGVDFYGNSNADLTLERLIENANCPGVDYRPVNIDPFLNQEGGQPGGNIRVAFIYNANKIGFIEKSPAHALEETLVQTDGTLNHNPGRVAPNDRAFRGSRKSIVAQFTFKGERITIIGNHLNSKLGDGDLWGALQPVNRGSEASRARKARVLHDFVEKLKRQDPRAHVIVLGDMNAYITENAMHVLEGRVLKNMMTYANLLAKEERYTTNHNGNSQALDYIFVDQNLLNKKPEIEPLHINSDYMGKLSDHDPVIARFKF